MISAFLLSFCDFCDFLDFRDKYVTFCLRYRFRDTLRTKTVVVVATSGEKNVHKNLTENGWKRVKMRGVEKQDTICLKVGEQ